jgi:hypothetical protein
MATITEGTTIPDQTDWVKEAITAIKGIKASVCVMIVTPVISLIPPLIETGFDISTLAWDNLMTIWTLVCLAFFGTGVFGFYFCYRDRNKAYQRIAAETPKAIQAHIQRNLPKFATESSEDGQHARQMAHYQVPRDLVKQAMTKGRRYA